MRIWVRVDASTMIGSGHVFRCLALATFLNAEGYKVIFICREFEGNLATLIKSRGFDCILLDKVLPYVKNIESEEVVTGYSEWLGSRQVDDAFATVSVIQNNYVSTVSKDWVLIDHYALDCSWELFVSSRLNCKLAAIDGQANRKHNVEVLIDPTVCYESSKWLGLLASKTKLLQGFTYAILHPRFYEAKHRANIRKKLERIFVCFGGLDRDNYTMKTLSVLSNYHFDVDVVVGAQYPYLDKIKKICMSNTKFNLYSNIENIEEIMLRSDMSVGSAGTLAWERCVLYLPSIVVSIAENQKKQVNCIDSLGVGLALNECLGYEFALNEAILKIMDNKILISEMSLNAFEVSRVLDDKVWHKVFD